jgi:penicillin-binding protein 1A
VKERVISPQKAFIMTHLLEGVVQHGTGQGAKSLGRPISGKTGTTSDYGDAWFIGYTPSVLTAVWVGFDDKSSLGKDETGARAALPIWVSFMNQALRGTSVEPFKVPPGVTLVKVNLETGLPSSGGPPDTVMEAFLDGTVPGEGGGQEREGSSLGTSAREMLPSQRIDAP